jgi:hypothetical protein
MIYRTSDEDAGRWIATGGTNAPYEIGLMLT